ncbi:hypothetical protein OOT46_07425 [Aquabacterium sp. A7-Y]|uniref:hypothetical protein n=1 Tax=Aquabacterium sp. A7-Y TaxID=1349605 RepID=UPI00223DE8A5|nr:hypothetical protein [Aquabacterium sp. A7-Y]MCW7537679.1 hypothetical protein [Aquabacterium sp. A7-Y]
MKLELDISIYPGDYNAAELHISFRAGNFSGEGRGWLRMAELDNFSKAIKKFPLGEEPYPCLAAGVWNEAATELVQEHLYFKVSPEGARGAVRFLVRLAVPDDSAAADGIAFSASANIRTNYEMLREMADALASLADGDASEIKLVFPVD